MVTALNDYQFEILPSAEASAGYIFGIGADVTNELFDPGENSWLSQDSQNTRRGVKAFGRDVLTSKVWLFQSSTDQDDVQTALAVLDDISSAWMPEQYVRNPGKVAAIRYRLGGRDRRVFGRPRRYAAPPTNLIMNGYVPIMHDFETVDSFTYDDLESSATIPYSTSVTGGGFTFPVTFPVLTESVEGIGEDQLSIGGNARTYPIIRFNGPWTNPVMTTDHWTLAWDGAIADGDYVEIDCRPWALTILRASGASAAEGLKRRVWLEDIWFPAKSQPQIHLSGAAASGAASALVRWRNAWTSI